MKINMFIVDYRGFGKAKAYSTVRGFVADAFEAYEYLSKTVKPENIILWGESMGGYAALKVAQLKPVGYLALAATFTKSTDMVEYLGLPFYYKFIAKREPLNNIKMISNIRVPTVILHSIEDDVIPYRCGEELYDKCHSKSKLFITLQGTHSNPKITTENLQWLLDFCQINSKVSDVEPILEKIYKDTQKACPLKLPETFES